MVIIFREQTPTITPFYNLADAMKFADEVGAQWSETYVVQILKGPLT